MSACIANVIATMVILRPRADTLGYTGKGAIQGNMNVDTLCRYLNKDGIAFVQPHSWEKLQFASENRVSAIANNTRVICDAFRICLRLRHLMTQFRSYRLWIWQGHACDSIRKDRWMPRNQ